MKTDLYTKIVLTVIAVCLTISLLKEFEIIPSAKANAAATIPNPIATATENNVVDVNIVKINGYGVYSGNLPVEVKK